MIRQSWNLGLLVLFFGVAVAAQGATYPGTVLNTGPGNTFPLGYFQMNETSGTTALDSAGTAQDGTYVNGPTLNQAGPQSPAFPGFSATNAAPGFDGTDDHVFNSSLPFSNNTTYTATGWMFNTRANDASVITGYVLSRGTAEPNFDAFGIMGTLINPGRLFLYNGVDVAQGRSVATANSWHHVAYARSGTDVVAYLDGDLQLAQASYANNVSSSDFYIGQRSDGQFAMQGKMDEVAVYDNAVLSGKQINAQYNAAFSTGLFSVNNSDFELQNVSNAAPGENQVGTGDGAYSQNLIQGWAGDGISNYGVFNPEDAQYAGTSGDANPIPGGNGNQVGYITSDANIVSVTQTLPDLVQAGTYDFTLAIGSRLDRGSAGYTLALLAGNTVVASETNAIDLDSFANDGALHDRTVSWTVPLGDPLIGQLLSMQISNTFNSGLLSTDFDNARLTFVPIPEPSGLALLSLGGLGMGFLNRKHRRVGRGA